MFNYSANKNFESWLGWFREADLNIGEAASTEALTIAAGAARTQAWPIAQCRQHGGLLQSD
jgi:hypothetical protein